MIGDQGLPFPTGSIKDLSRSMGLVLWFPTAMSR